MIGGALASRRAARGATGAAFVAVAWVLGAASPASAQLDEPRVSRAEHAARYRRAPDDPPAVPRRRGPYADAPAAALLAIEGAASSQLELGLGVVLGSVAVGLVGGISLGIASQTRATSCEPHILLRSCVRGEHIVARDDALAGAAIGFAVAGTAVAAISGFAIVMPATIRRGRVRRELRLRAALSVSAEGAVVTLSAPLGP